MVWPFKSARDRLDDEAARWAIRMRGAERERHRAAFERWCQANLTHGEAFAEAMAALEEAGILQQGELGRARQLPEAHRKAVPLRYAFGAVAAAAALALIFLVSAVIPSNNPVGEGATRYATGDEAREFSLPDGSGMALAQETIAVVAFTPDERSITLERGSGRFSVARGTRPFRVAAGETEVLAHGTIFEVSMAAGRTRVALIEGSVDVSYPAIGGAESRLVRRLQPGQHIVVGGPPQTAVAAAQQRPPAPSPAPRRQAAPTMLQFDDTPLAEAVAAANRHSRTQIVLADPAIGELKITGAFRTGDAGALAESLAAAFSLRLERGSGGTLILDAAPPSPPVP